MVHCAAAERFCTCSAGGGRGAWVFFFLCSVLFPGKSLAAGVWVEEGSVCLKTVENLISLVAGELATGLAAEESILGLVVESTLTAHSSGSVLE